jgi:hypothetical protein
MVTSDLLGASGLLVAVIGVLYSVWYDEITRGASVRVARHRLDRATDIATVRRILLTRAAPLTAAGICLVAVLAPPAIDVVSRAFTTGFGHPYDAVKACFLLVWVFGVGLTLSTAASTFTLVAKYRSLLGPDLA